jgi:hypothetical protein
MSQQTPQQEYERALERATAAGLSVVADGWTGAGERVYFVPSSQDNRHWYHVVVERDGFHCSCAQGTDGRGTHYCTHRALARQAYLQEAHGLQQAEERAREPKPARTDGRVVTYDGRPGRGSRCASCSKSFTTGENIALVDGKAYHPLCADTTAPGSRPGDDAPVARDNKPFSIFKQ